MYGGLINLTVLTLTVTSCMRDIPARKFPYNSWLPDVLKTGQGYWIAYFHQNIANAYLAYIHIVFDVFLCNIMMVTCTHLKILKFRISTMHENNNTTRDSKRIELVNEKNQIEYEYLITCTKHHLAIYQLRILLYCIFI